MTPTQIPRAKDLMRGEVAAVAPDMRLAEVMEFLQRHQLASAPVVEQDAGEQAVLVGFISEGDCLEFLANEVFFGSPAPAQTARTMMKRHPVCVVPETDIFALASIFVNHRLRLLPVVDGDRLIGVVSRHDVLHGLDRYYRQAIRQHDTEKIPRDLHEVANLRFVTRP